MAPANRSNPERHRAVLAAATRLCRHYGHTKMTIADVAREARIAVGSVYKEFDSKEAIIEALSGDAYAEIAIAMRACAERHADAPFEARFVAVLLTRTTTFLALGERGAHACELLHCKASGVTNAHARFRDQELAIYEGLLHDGRVRGETTDAPRPLARLVQQAFACLSPPAIFGVDDAPARTRELAHLLVHGLASRSAPERAPRSRGRRESVSPSAKAKARTKGR